MVPSPLSGSGVFVAVIATRLSCCDRQLAWRRIVVDESLVSRTDISADRRRRCGRRRRRRRLPLRSPIVGGDRGQPSWSQPVQASGHRLGVPRRNSAVAARRQAIEDALATPSAAASRQETAQCVHAVHEGDAIKGDRRMHAKGVCRHQPDSRQKGVSDNYDSLWFRLYYCLLTGARSRIPCRKWNLTQSTQSS